MRTVLDNFYRAVAILACIALIVLAIMIVLQIVARFFNVAVIWASDVSGYALVATSFLALAPTFRYGVHVRVSLLFTVVNDKVRRGLEIWCLLLCILLSGYLAYACVDMTLESWRFNDVSTGLVPFKLWMPQSIMALGAVVFAIANVDALIGVLMGRTPIYELPAREDDSEGAETSP